MLLFKPLKRLVTTVKCWIFYYFLSYDNNNLPTGDTDSYNNLSGLLTSPYSKLN